LLPPACYPNYPSFFGTRSAYGLALLDGVRLAKFIGSFLRTYCTIGLLGSKLTFLTSINCKQSRSADDYKVGSPPEL
jgi:hypothetical protein